jgi:hypothetical protein
VVRSDVGNRSVSHAKSLVIVESGVLQGLIETSDRSLVHLVVLPIAAMNPHY